MIAFRASGVGTAGAGRAFGVVSLASSSRTTARTELSSRRQNSSSWVTGRPLPKLAGGGYRVTVRQVLPLLVAALLSADPAPLKIKASALIQAYADNEIGADAAHKGKVLTVTGPVFAVGKAVDGSFFVAVTDRPSWIVHCQLETNDPAAGALKTGKPVKVTGTNAGLKRGAFSVIMLTGCKL